MKYPDKQYTDPARYFDDYAGHVAAALATVSRSDFTNAAMQLDAAIKRGATIYTCGNGGSAAIANHLVCDCVKGVQTDTLLKPCVHSLSSNIEILTAIANDIAYAQVFAYQLSSFAKPGDVLIAITSSGNSANIVNALKTARALGMLTIAMTGFAGGSALKETEIALHVDAQNYGVIEDAHQSLMHALAQFLRQHNMSDPFLCGTRTF